MSFVALDCRLLTLSAAVLGLSKRVALNIGIIADSFLVATAFFMDSLFSLFDQPLNSDRLTIVRSIIYLRLTILAAACLLLFTVHFGVKSVPERFTLLTILIGVGFWSFFCLLLKRPLDVSSAITREFIIDFIWVLLVVLLSGGSASPFIYYYLVLVATCAVSLSTAGAWAFCLAGIGIYSALLVMDAKDHFRHFPEEYRLHLFGMWLNYVGSSLVVCFFVTRLSLVLRTQQMELADAREANLKNEQLIGIGTVAASTVHSLATPIATLTVLAEEIINDSGVSQDVHDDAQLMLTQIDRCKRTMNQLSTLAQNSSDVRAVTLADLLADLRDHYAINSPDAIPIFDCAYDVVDRKIRCNALFQYALINLVNNAMESSNKTTSIEIRCKPLFIEFLIGNTSALADEFVARKWGNLTQSDKGNGLGIGSFLANSTIEKQGGHVEFNASSDLENPGLTFILVTVSIPLAEGQE